VRFFTGGERLGRPECPYLVRWALCHDRVGSVRVHHWLHGDDPRAHHDHAWWFLTVVLRGSYIDRTAHGDEVLRAGAVRVRGPLHRHTVVVPAVGCWTLLLTGPVVRRWGFWVARPRGLKFLKQNKYFWRHGHHPCG
jgi:hypothetical protein